MKKIVGAWFGFLFSVLAAAAAIDGSTDQQDKGMNGLQKMIVEMLDGPIDDRKIRALKTYAATNGISESTLVSTVENLSEKRLLEFGPRPLESYWACASVWSVIESLGSIEFLPFLEKQSNSQFEQYHEHAERVYVLIAGIDAEPFLYKKFKSEDYVWSQSPQKHFFGFLRQEERKNPSSPKVNSGYAQLIEQ